MERLKRIAAWLIDRAALAPIIGFLRTHKVPRVLAGRIGWMYVFGTATLTAFVVQLVTGAALASKYVPSPASAYESLQHITHDAPFGATLRGLHFYGASAMVVLITVHLLRVFLTGAFKFPRELSWMSGVLLFALTFAMAFTGQLLRWDQDGYWTVLVASKFAGRVPLVGDWLRDFVLAGQTVGGTTLTRFYSFHVFVLPALIIGLIGFHLYLVIQNGISEPPVKGEKVDKATYREKYRALKDAGVPWVPFVAWREVVMSDLVLAAITALALVFGPKQLTQPPDPTDLVADPRPDWFLIWYYALLWVKPRGLETPIMVWLPLLLLAGALLLPLVFATGERSPQRRPIAVALVLLSGVLLGWLLVLGMRAPWVPKVNTEPLTAAQVGHAEGPVWRGSQLYFEKGCQYCHLALGRGGRYGPDLTDVLLRLSPEATATRIVAGIGDMPAYRSALTDRELEDLMSFLRAMAERHSGMAGPAEPDQGGQR